MAGKTESLTIGQRVVMHLDRYKTLSTTDEFNVPWELTQDGIATALRISRAHASIELKKLRAANKVEEKQTHVKGGKVKRMTYRLTSLGLEDVPKIKEFAEKKKIDIDSLLDIKRWSQQVFVEELCDDDRYAFGCACAFRTSVPLDMLPETKKFVIPRDVEGYTVIDDYLRDKVLSSVPEEERSLWYMYAINTWFDDGGKKLGDIYDFVQEMLYLYTTVGANRDACKFVSNYRFEITDNANEDIYESLKRISKVTDSKAVDVYSVMADVALSCKYESDVPKYIEKIKESDFDTAALYQSKYLFAIGDNEGAKTAVKGLVEKTPYAKIAMADYLIHDGDLEGAEVLLTSISNLQGHDYGDVGVEKFQRLATIALKRKRKDDALHYLMKAKASFDNERMKKRIDRIIVMHGLNEQ